jgi:type IV secretory pathway VirD2 relaxase
MTDDREFEPRLGRIRSSGGGRGKSYLQRVLRAAALSGPGGRPGSDFVGSRAARGYGAGRVLAKRDHFSPFRSRRVVVKTRIVKMRGEGAKAAAAHLRYIQRDGVTVEGAPGELYSRDADREEGGDFLRRAEGDRHQFRFIISAEDAGEYEDLKPFVRKLMARMEVDLGTGLDWVAVDHHNTGHPHSHIVLRGKDDLGQDLVIARDYIAHGMRERAAEILTLDLGPRTDLEIESRLARQVSQERLTDLDRLLRRAATAEGAVSIGDNPASVSHDQWAGRLQTLGRLSLAEEATPGAWRLSPDLELTLRQMGEREDIIKTMHRALGERSASRSTADLVAGEASEAPLVGQVLSRGLCDDRVGAHFVVIDGTDGRVHYVEISESTDAAIATGAIVRLGIDAGKTRRVDQTIAGIARTNGGTYSPTLHRASDPTARPEYVESHVRRLEAMRRVTGSVERHPDGSWAIPDNHEANGAAFDRTRDPARVHLLSPVPVERLRTARAQTWLDRELVADAPTPVSEKGFGHQVRQGLAQRRAFLIAEGFATQQGDRVHYPRDMLASLQGQELGRASAELGKSIGKPYAQAADGKLDGVCRGPVHLISGKFAVVERSRDFTLVPWRPVLERQIGKPIHGIVRGREVSWSLGRTKGPNIG